MLAPISCRDHVRQARLTEPGGAAQQDVSRRLLPLPSRFEDDPQILLDRVLTHELVQGPRAQRDFGLEIDPVDVGSQHVFVHASTCRAALMTSSMVASVAVSTRLRATRTSPEE